MNLVRNLPTSEGFELGAHLARFADHAEADRKKHFPMMQERCSTCAFRKGTVPNGCVTTLMDAAKCVLEKVDFICHERTDTPCSGWYSLAALPNPIVMVPWDFSDEEEPNGPEVPRSNG